MLQFNYSDSSNVNTFWVDLGSLPFAGLNQIALEFTSSYSGKKTTTFSDITSTKFGEYGGWILIDTIGSEVPSNSGQYDLNIFQADTGSAATWGSYSFTWGGSSQTYANASTAAKTGSLLTTERGFVSGSDFDTIKKYEYQDEPVYSVYDG